MPIVCRCEQVFVVNCSRWSVLLRAASFLTQPTAHTQKALTGRICVCVGVGFDLAMCVGVPCVCFAVLGCFLCHSVFLLHLCVFWGVDCIFVVRGCVPLPLRRYSLDLRNCSDGSAGRPDRTLPTQPRAHLVTSFCWLPPFRVCVCVCVC